MTPWADGEQKKQIPIYKQINYISKIYNRVWVLYTIYKSHTTKRYIIQRNLKIYLKKDDDSSRSIATLANAPTKSAINNFIFSISFFFAKFFDIFLYILRCIYMR